jgi:hypothetical protein
MTKPSAGSQVYWRLNSPPGKYRWEYGYVKYVRGHHDLIQMGRYSGDMGGQVVSANDIEWRDIK